MMHGYRDGAAVVSTGTTLCVVDALACRTLWSVRGARRHKHTEVFRNGRVAVLVKRSSDVFRFTSPQFYSSISRLSPFLKL